MGYPDKSGYLRQSPHSGHFWSVRNLVVSVRRSIHMSRLVHAGKTQTNFESPHLSGYPTNYMLKFLPTKSGEEASPC